MPGPPHEFDTVDHPKHGKGFAYEVDGYGSHLLMDNANVPSLLALPYLGFVEATDPVYLNARRLALSPDSPSYFSNGDSCSLSGIDSPHTGFRRVWLLSIAIQALTSTGKQEIADAVCALTASTSGLGLTHEHVDIDSVNGHSFAGAWKPWCNAVVGELIARVVAEHPGLL